MSVVILGGLARLKKSYENQGKNHGCDIRVYSQRVPNLGERLRRVNGIVIITGNVAHSMVKEALTVAKKYRIPVSCQRSSSVGALTGCLRTIRQAQI